MALSRDTATASLETFPLLEKLREDPRFQAALAEIWTSQRPGVPTFDPKDTIEENAALIERIKFAYGMQKGFDLLFSLLVGKTL